MFSSLLIDASGKAHPSPPVDRCPWEAEAAYQQAVQHLVGHLAAAPATFAVVLPCGSLPSVHLEWQSIFASVGVAYLGIAKAASAVCLLLTGQHAGAEAAAVEAARSMLASQNPGGAKLHEAFGAVSRQQRPLLVTIVHDSESPTDTLAVRFAAHALAAAFFSDQVGTASAALSRTPAHAPNASDGPLHPHPAAFVPLI